jgi:phosphatidylserine/phosphatidylglycerophosphate/cardiolipin synthase-like enzyme
VLLKIVYEADSIGGLEASMSQLAVSTTSGAAATARMLRELQAAEKDLKIAHAALAVADAEVTASSKRSQVLQFVDAPQSAVQWIQRIGAATRSVHCAFFTFDLPELVEALVFARSRGVAVLCLLDRQQTMSGSCLNVRPAIQQLIAHGVVVKLHRQRRLHAKWLLADKFLIVGSCNATKASQGNEERGVVVQMSASDLIAELARFNLLFDSATAFEDAQATTPSRRPQTAQRSKPTTFEPN